MEENCPTIKRPSLKSHPRFNNSSFWKDKLRENCYKRVREDRTRLLWKMRLHAAQSFNHKEFIKSSFQDIVSDELRKIKDSSINAYQGECEGLLLEMQRIFYEDHRRETEGKEPKEGIEAWEYEQDEYLALAVYDHMQLNNEQKLICPSLNRGDEVNLDVLRDQLAEAHADHSKEGVD
ncbi:Detected protein of unknown function [Hibiscus syriacus]|uniref:Uncharacterized protein n=1 Tax=Hibiscus syriacus TaxID=106335 RepID=A0A6A3CFT4_HIBSY|nr:Detected protein of unknown function [Hibiscus syriacus]